MVSGVRFHLLGPVVVEDREGSVIDVRGPQRRTLLARLLVDRGRVVSTDELLEALCSGSGSAPAAATLHSHVSQLRRLLPEDVIETQAPGYLLRVANDAVDADRFERDLADARRALDADDPTRALASVERALGRCRGPALAGFADRPWAETEAARLEELRRDAVELRIAALLDLGRASDAAAGAEEAVADAPLREERWRLLLLALYRSGRQADALRAYQRCRTMLHDELGLEPSKALRELERAILDQAPDLDLPMPPVADRRSASGTSGALPPPTRLSRGADVALAGRVAELQRLTRALKAAVGGEGSVALISGEPGIGKTRLAQELAARATQLGAIVLHGGCEERVVAPYSPWSEVVAHLLHHTGDERVLEQAAATAADLARLGPAVATTLRVGPTRAGLDDGSGQAAVVSAVAGLLRAAAAGSPILVVLDDLHWADQSSLALVHHLATKAPIGPLLLVATYRDTDLVSDHPLAALLADLWRVPGVERLALSGLGIDDVVALIENAAGHGLGDDGLGFARHIHEEAAGNPFFTIELLRHAADEGVAQQAEDGRWSLRAPGRPALPHSVREVVALRTARLGSDVELALGTAAVIGRAFDAALVAGAGGWDRDDVLDQLDAACRAGLLVELPDAPGSYAFTHALVRHALLAAMAPGTLRRAHRAVARSLAEARSPSAGDIAAHWIASGDGADRATVVAAAVAAGEEALGRLAPNDAMRWFGEAEGWIDGEAPVELRARLTIGRGDAQRQLGDPAHRTTLLEAAELAAKAGRTDLLVAAALANSRGSSSRTGQLDPDRIRVAERALHAVGSADTPERALLLGVRAAEASGDWLVANALAEEAVEVAERLADPAVTIRVLNLVNALYVPESLDRRLARTPLAVAQAEALGDRTALGLALQRRVVACLQAGDVAGARAALDRLSAVAEDLDQPFQRWLALGFESTLLLLAGDPSAAEAAAEQALEEGVAAGQDEAFGAYVSELMEIRRHQGRLAEVEPLFTQAATEYRHIVSLAIVAANVQAEVGLLDQAAATLAPMMAVDFVIDHDAVLMVGLNAAAEVVALLGDLPAARVLRRRLAPFAGQTDSTPIQCRGSVAGRVALLDELLGDHASADSHFAAALACHRRMRAPFLVTGTLLDQAAALLRRGSARAAVAPLLDEAASLASRYGYASLAERTAVLTAVSTRQRD